MIWTTRLRSEVGHLRAICAGKGPTVVLIHGVGLRAEAWGGQLDDLAQGCRVVAVDMPGHGDSPRLAHTPDLAAFTDAIMAAIDGSAVVIGHSFGAMIALDMAARYPTLVRGVGALNAIHQRDTSARQAVLARAAQLDGQTVADPSPTLDRWFGTTPSAERDACAAWLRTVDPAGYRDAYRIFAAEDGPTETMLGALSCPALFVTGQDEPNSTPAMSRRMAGCAPLGKAIILEQAAHMMPMTHAAQVTQILKQFVKDCTA